MDVAVYWLESLGKLKKIIKSDIVCNHIVETVTRNIVPGKFENNTAYNIDSKSVDENMMKR